MRWFLTVLILFPILTYGQDSIQRNWSLNGYFTNMQSFMFQKFDGDWISDNLIHNRLNFKWNNTSNSLNAALEVRNRFITGESVRTIPGYADQINTDNGFIKMSKNISTGASYILNSKIDRAFIDYTKDKFQVRIGRQRINWGQCYTWNPNDLFNTYSFFDFDYIEKPGSDAIRFQYFANSTSTLEMAVKANNSHKITTAALYRFNKWNYDIQFLGGIMDENDYVIGTGWSGNIKGASFRGEISYFRPMQNFKDTSAVLVISLGSEYTFRNSLMLQLEVLYNQNKNQGISSFADYYSMNLSAKNLSFTEFSIFLQCSYPITPLFNISFATMYFPALNGFYTGPSLTYSLSQNIDFSVIAQSFAGDVRKGVKEYYHLGFLRLKWNF